MKSVLSKLIPSSFKRKLRYNESKSVFDKGYADYLKTHKTSAEAYMALINLYCYSNGRFTDDIHNQIKKNNYPKLKQPEQLSNLLTGFSDKDFSDINGQLNDEGYSVFQRGLTDETCDKLMDFSKETPALFKKGEAKALYDAINPLSEIYRFDITDLMNNEIVQKLIMDPSLIEIARNYLECEPIFDFPAMWWSTAFSKAASADAAQLYHFDMDRIKWIKIFFYITDVDDDNGPHCYISHSQKTGNKPQSLLDRGYVRISDEELRPFYPSAYFKELLAKRGTIFAGDTKCWHKGKPLEKGDRLVLELEYTSSLFGINYKSFCSKPTDEFKAFCNNNKVFSSNIDFK